MRRAADGWQQTAMPGCRELHAKRAGSTWMQLSHVFLLQLLVLGHPGSERRSKGQRIAHQPTSSEEKQQRTTDALAQRSRLLERQVRTADVEVDVGGEETRQGLEREVGPSGLPGCGCCGRAESVWSQSPVGAGSRAGPMAPFLSEAVKTNDAPPCLPAQQRQSDSSLPGINSV